MPKGPEINNETNNETNIEVTQGALGSVKLFSTCLVQLIYPNVDRAVLEVLRKLGVDFEKPPGQTCCGQPAYNAGYIKSAREVARRNLKLFSKAMYIVVPSGSCAAMMQKHYAHLFTKEELGDFSERILEFSEFLYLLIKEKGINLSIKTTNTEKNPPENTEEKIQNWQQFKATRVVWHSSCHQKRELKASEPKALELLQSLPNVQVLSAKQEELCCGFGGVFSVKQSDISVAMADQKIREFLKLDFDHLISGDMGCLIQMKTRLNALGIFLSCQHLAEFLDTRL